MSPLIRGPAVPRRRLGAELRRLREEAGLLIEDVARVLECSPSKISRLENGKGIPKTRDVRDILALFGITDTKLRDRLLGWASAGRQQGWWQEFSDVMQLETVTAELDNYIALEADASRKWEFQTTIVPGLLQTENYARAIFEALPYSFSTQHVDRLVELRLRRQEVLYREDGPLELICVIDEPALHRPVGSDGAMVEQLHKLAAEAQRPNIAVKILPMRLGAHPAVMGSFELLEYADDKDHEIVNIESLTGTASLEGKLDIQRYRRVLQEVVEKSQDLKQSRELINAALDRLHPAETRPSAVGHGDDADTVRSPAGRPSGPAEP